MSNRASSTALYAAMLPVTQRAIVVPFMRRCLLAYRDTAQGRSGLRLPEAHDTSRPLVMGLAVGIVGLPNVGKSTLFNALSSAKAEAANYPFCTIEPNVGVVAVPDDRLRALDGVVHAKRIVPATSTSSTSPASSEERIRAKAWAISFCRTFAKSTPSSKSCAVSKTRTSFTSKTASIRWPTSRRSRPNFASRISRPSRSVAIARANPEGQQRAGKARGRDMRWPGATPRRGRAGARS